MGIIQARESFVAKLWLILGVEAVSIALKNRRSPNDLPKANLHSIGTHFKLVISATILSDFCLLNPSWKANVTEIKLAHAGYYQSLFNYFMYASRLPQGCINDVSMML